MRTDGNEEATYGNSLEITREDGKGKFLTIADKTDFESHYNFIYCVPDAQKRGQDKVRPPFHKIAFNLVVHEPKAGEPKMGRTHFLEVDDFQAWTDEILFRNMPPDPNDPKTKWGIEVLKAVGYSKNEGRQLSLWQMASQGDASKSTFKFEFKWGEAEMKQESTGFKFLGTPQKLDIFLPEYQVRKMMIEMNNHIQAVRTAVFTRYLQQFHDKKSN